MKKLLLLMMAFVAIQVSAQDLAHYKKIVKQLSSAKYQGRGYAEDGANKAGKWIAKEFKKAGVDEVVCQPFKLHINTFPGKMNVKVDGKKFVPGVDFTVREFNPGLKGQFKLYYVDMENFDAEKMYADLATPEYEGAFVECDFMFSMKNGKAYCFLGKSGTGKSTHSGLWLEHIADTDLLNDDNPAIRVMEGVVYVYGTPWSGKTPCYRNLRMLAGGFLRLEQAPENSIRCESKLQGFASIISSCSSMIWDKPSYHAICDTVSMVAERVPVFYLRNLPNRDAALLSHATMTGEA